MSRKYHTSANAAADEAEAAANAVQPEPVREREREPGDRSAPPPQRDGDPKIYLAELRRGIVYMLEQSPVTLVFTFARKVPISAKEYAYLAKTATDPLEFNDDGPDGGRAVKLVQKFNFYDRKTGEKLPDVEVSMPEETDEPQDAYGRYMAAQGAKAVRIASGVRRL